MNSCEFLTIKEEIKSLKKEIKKTTKKLKKLELKARKCFYSNLGKYTDSEIIDLYDEFLEDYHFNQPVEELGESFVDVLYKYTDENGLIDLNDPVVEETLIKYIKNFINVKYGISIISIDDKTAKAILNSFKGQYEEELDNE